MAIHVQTTSMIVYDAQMGLPLPCGQLIVVMEIIWIANGDPLAGLCGPNAVRMNFEPV